MLSDTERDHILNAAKEYFLQHIIKAHKENIAKLDTWDEFNINPFLYRYLAYCAFGSDSSRNIAKALIYPRILGTSITTSFGTNMQDFCSEVLQNTFGSKTSGIDIEFEDQIDHRHKYCQVKAGPNTLNRGDVAPTLECFKKIGRLARTNHDTELNPLTDIIMGVLYGTQKQLSGHYKEIAEEYPVICGQEFWYRLTGDETFYEQLIHSLNDIALEGKNKHLVDTTIKKLAKYIEDHPIKID